MENFPHTSDSHYPGILPEIDFRAELNDQQFAAVTSPGGPALVIAGAGSGKTRTLTFRVAWLLNQGVDPFNILLLTFTNKAAREMMSRVRDLAGMRLDGMWGGTFHSICSRILRRNASVLGFSPSFTILDRDDQKSMFKRLYADLEISAKAKFPKPEVVISAISLAVNRQLDLADVIADEFPQLEEFTETISRLRDAYTRRKLDSNAMDFDDLLVLAVQLLETHPHIAQSLASRFQHVLVDEYQDTNQLQEKLVRLLSSVHGNLMVVGDDAQSIYSWRGADIEHILAFSENYPDAQIFKIETNYRSRPEILALSNETIRQNLAGYQKTLVSSRESVASVPQVISCFSGKGMAKAVAQNIRRLVSREGVSPSDIAILYRAHYQSMDVQMELTKLKIPFNITSGLRFFETAHVKDVLAILRFALNLRDEMAFRRILQLLPGVGEKTIEKLWQTWISCPEAASSPLSPSHIPVLAKLPVPAKARDLWSRVVSTYADSLAPDGTLLPPGDILQDILEAYYLELLALNHEDSDDRAQELREVQKFARGFYTLDSLLEQIALLTDMDDANPDAPVQPRTDSSSNSSAVTCSTIHQAKGLEWKVVFVIGLGEGMFPTQRAIEAGPDTIEEERRLFYVACTRAMDQLYLLYARMGNTWSNFSGEPSRFICELPSHVFLDRQANF